MIEQQSFNYGAPRSRRNDPGSSKRAAERLDRSGTMRGQRKLALALVKEFPGRSSKELAELGTLDRYQLARRLPELLELHFVRREQTGSDDSRWYAVI